MNNIKKLKKLFLTIGVSLIILPLFFNFSFFNKKPLSINNKNGEMLLKDIEASSNSSAALYDDEGKSRLFMWGDNTYGELGLGDQFTEDNYNTPQELIIPDGWTVKDIASGSSSNTFLAIANDGNKDYLYSWGNNNKGQLGLGDQFTEDSYNTPQRVYMDEDYNSISKIKSNGNFSGAIFDIVGVGDNLYLWGDNSRSQLGLGSGAQLAYNTPQLTSLSKYKPVFDFALGEDFTISENNLASDQYSLYGWGNNRNGQLGLGAETQEIKDNHFLNVTSASLDNDTIVCGDDYFIFAYENYPDETKKVSVSGNNNKGQLGIGLPDETIWNTKTYEFNYNDNAIISAGKNSTIAINDGKMFGWGDNSNGQLGLGEDSQDEYRTPTEVTSFDASKTSIIKIGKSHSLTNNEKNVYVTGKNDNGQLGTESDLTLVQKTFVPLISDEVSDLDNARLVDSSKGTSATISTEVIGAPISNTYSPYSLEVIDNSSQVVGKSMSGTLFTNGTKLFDIVGLEKDHNYGMVKVRVVEKPTITSNEFNLTTSLSPIVDLNNATTTGDMKKTSATIKVDAHTSSSFNGNVIDYSLEVINSESEIIGISDSGTLNTDGTQTFNITGLEHGTDYGMVKVRVVENPEILSNEFNLVTLKNSITELTNAKIVGEVEPTLANISVDANVVSPSTDNEDVLDYSLEVIDSNFQVVGVSDSGILNTDGTQTFSIKDLTPGTDYGKVKVRITDNQSILSNEFDLVTPLKKVTSLENLLLISVTTHTATFSIDAITSDNLINETETINPYRLEVIDESGVSLGESNTFYVSGKQTLTIDGLDIGKDYGQVKIWVKEDHNVVSDTTVDLYTVKDSVISLSEHQDIANITYDSIEIKPTVTSNEGEIDVLDYKLVVKDIINGKSWSKDFDKANEVTIEIDELDWWCAYSVGRLTIEIDGIPDSKKDVDYFSTLPSPVTPEKETFDVLEETIQRHTFEFSIVIDIDASFKGEFDPSILTLLSDGQELNIKPKSSEGNVFTYEVSDLTAQHTYKNFMIKNKKSPHDQYQVDQSITATTAISIWTKYSIWIGIILSALIIGIIALVSFLIVRKIKQRRNFERNLKKQW